MNLVDKYISEIGKHLPPKNRADVEAEIRSTLQDMLEERSANSGRPIDETLIIEVVKEYGSPYQVAQLYQNTQYLIGPRLYPIFEMVVKIVLSVLAAAALLSFGLNFLNNTSGPGFLSALGQFLAQTVSGLISAFGNITLIFAVLERVLPKELKIGLTDAQEWDVSDLMRKTDSDEIKTSNIAVSIALTAIVLVVLNLYPDFFSIRYVTNQGWITIGVLSEAFFNYLPWINLLGITGIGFQLFLLRQSNWKRSTRLVKMVLEIGTIILASTMLSGPALVNIPAENMPSALSAEAIQQLIGVVNIVPGLILVITIVTSAVEIAQTVHKMK